MAGKYSSDPAWADITPLPPPSDGPNPLAAIAYSDEYADTMSYLRAVMAANEFSPRVLQLTEDLIDMNPAHYTVWLYRAKCLFELDSDLRQELEWLNEIALEHQKNYQIWHHRMLVVDKLGECDGEGEFVEKMFERDAKNYHVWSYRQWMVRRFELWDQGELEFTERTIDKDVRNNSAWNHRWFVINGREGDEGMKDEEVYEREVAYAKRMIRKAPQNECGWNYAKGCVKRAGKDINTLADLVLEFGDVTRPDEVRSSFALDLAVDIYAKEGRKVEAEAALDLLSSRYDPIRKNFWEYRKHQLGQPAAAA
jgi:protein farnesyltransferase/geranylgeranyltransferase type-1 subunit alpha